MLANFQSLIMSFLCLEIVVIINPAIRSCVIQDVMFARTLFHQIQLVSLSIEHILSGYKNIVHRMSVMVLLAVVAVKDWSQWIPNICCLTMVESCAWSVLT
ncbi:hypothetical protein AAZV13_12G130850 [Glycine max]